MILPLAYAYCNVSVMPVRSEPNHKAEQTTQMLFGEKAEIVEVSNSKEWARIHITHDDYEGWCKLSQVSIIQKREYRKDAKYMAGSHRDKLIMQDGELFLPLGSELTGLKAGKLKAAHEYGRYKGKRINIKKETITGDSVKAAVFQYLHAPYQWGGRSVAGIDCSGLTQMAFKLCDKRIARDASQQATQGEPVDFLQHARCGDLAFFDNKEGKIIHVGMLLDNQTIIHATDTAGRVVVDRIDQGGIISVSLKMRTHNLRLIRRIF
jgi:gamma-D-glutamyl-L-lysine dipeptidyl-peptidase